MMSFPAKRLAFATKLTIISTSDGLPVGAASACSLRRTAVPLNPTLPKRQPHAMKVANTRRALACLATITCACLGLRSTHAADTAIQYNRDVRPILFENCFSCHGPDSASRQAELRLDKREAAVDKKAIVPGNADASEIIRRILSDDADEQMPPPVTKKKLTAEQKKLLAEWVKSGAEYQPHWSLIAP